LTDAEKIRLGGREILVRPIGPGDKELLQAAFERLSPESRYRRFFAPMERLSGEDLRYLTEVDHRDHEALVAFDPGDGQIIGVARYVRAQAPTEAEVAVVVADPWHGRGVATALLDRLVGRAREEGIDHFTALVLSDNEEALELFRDLASGEAGIRRGELGQTEMLIPLPEPGGVRESRLGRILGVVAREATTVNPWRALRRAIRRRETEEAEIP
jgi:GNAT superfamily N-acetyltransferase